MWGTKKTSQGATSAGGQPTGTSIFALPFVLVARLFAVFISLAIWCSIVLIVWIFIVLRTIALVSIDNVMTVFRGGDVAPSRNLDQAVELWPRGFVRIFAILWGGSRDETNDRPAADWREAARETIMATLFYCSLSLFILYAASHIKFIIDEIGVVAAYYFSGALQSAKRAVPWPR